MSKKQTQEARIEEIEDELDGLRYNLENNQGEQQELWSIERKLTSRIEELEEELDQIED